jgi:hypothetical protein
MWKRQNEIIISNQKKKAVTFSSCEPKAIHRIFFNENVDNFNSNQLKTRKYKLKSLSLRKHQFRISSNLRVW